MSSQQLDEISLKQYRIRIQARAHARRIANGLTYGDLFKSEGTVEGFAEWLFVRRKTFNGANPLQQAKAYVAGVRAARKNGFDLDAACKEQANTEEKCQERAERIFEDGLATVTYWCTETPVGLDVSVAMAEFSLGHGRCFAQSANGGQSTTDIPPSWLLDMLLRLLEALGGPDSALHRYDWQSTEEDVSRELAKRDGELLSIRENASRGQYPSEIDLRYLTLAFWALAGLLRVRTTLRGLFIQAQMMERIDRIPRVMASKPQAPARRGNRFV